MKAMLLLMVVIWVTVSGFLAATFTAVTADRITERNARIERIVSNLK